MKDIISIQAHYVFSLVNLSHLAIVLFNDKKERKIPPKHESEVEDDYKHKKLLLLMKKSEKLRHPWEQLPASPWKLETCLQEN